MALLFACCLLSILANQGFSSIKALGTILSYSAPVAPVSARRLTSLVSLPTPRELYVIPDFEEAYDCSYHRLFTPISGTQTPMSV